MGSGGRQCMFWNTVSIIMKEILIYFFFLKKKSRGIDSPSL